MGGRGRPYRTPLLWLMRGAGEESLVAAKVSMLREGEGPRLRAPVPPGTRGGVPRAVKDLLMGGNNGMEDVPDLSVNSSPLASNK